MFRTILMPVDDVELAGRIMWHVRRLLARESASLTLLRVVKPPRSWVRVIEATRPRSEHTLPRRLDAARRELEALAGNLRRQGIDVARVEVHPGDPADEILKAVGRLKPALVAMAGHGWRGPIRWILGSVAERVLRGCPVPLLLCNPEFRGTPGGRSFRRILVPLDGSALAASILPRVEDFAAIHDAEVVLLRVGPRRTSRLGFPVYVSLPPPTPAELEESLEEARDRLRKADVRVRVLTPLSDDVAGEILRRAEAERVDLVAMATHGRTGLDRWVFGSVAEKVLRNAPTPLLSLRVAGLQPTEAAPPSGARQPSSVSHSAPKG